MRPTTATPLWRAVCPFCARELQFKAAAGAAPTVVCGACGERFEAETTGRPGGGQNGGGAGNSAHARGVQLTLSEAEQLDLAIAMSLSDAPLSPQHAGRPQAGPSSNFWKCPQCVCSNAASASRCVCGHVRGAPPGSSPASRPSLASASVAATRCTKCTFDNPPSAAACSMCGHALRRDAAAALRRDAAIAVAAAAAAMPTAPARPPVARTPSFEAPVPQSVDERQAAQEAEAVQLLARIEGTCAEQRVPFVDDSFLPSDRSVYLDGREWSRAAIAERPPERQAEARVTQWLRPSEIRRGANAFDLFNQPWCVFRGEPLPEDAKQGALGDCWLLSAIAVLAERPSLLRALFPAGAALSRSGAYPVRLCLDGEWRVLVVDDLLPCTRHSTLAFSQAARRQLFVPLLEKAFAKAYGCYEAIEAGTCDEALAALTGAPCEQLRLQAREGSAEQIDTDLLWARLLSFRQAGFLAGASCGSRDAHAVRRSEALGLQTMHAYSLLDVRTSSRGDRLLLLRNPWGHGNWAGAWSARSPQWTAELRRELRHEHDDGGDGGGVFWMCWADFVLHFRDVDVCKVRAGSGSWMEARARAQMPTSAGPGGSWPMYCVEVFETTQLDLLLVQHNGRGRGGGEQALLDLCVCVFKAAYNGRLGELVACSPRRVHPSVCCEAMLSAGKYLLLPLCLNQLNSSARAPRVAVLALFSAKPVLIAKSDARADLAREALVARVVRHGERSAPFGNEMLLWNLSDEAGSMLYAENRSWMQRFTVTIDARESYNLVSSRAALQLDDRLAPGQGQLLLALTQLEPSEGYHSSFLFQFRADMGLEQHEPPVPATGGLHSSGPRSR